MTTAATRPIGLALLLAATAACTPTTAPDAVPDAAQEGPALTPEGDVLAPELYAFTGEALWDGRPSLGGVWVAHPEVDEPARVRIARPGGDAAVTGALFRRERVGEGPAMQVSSEAALALGLAAGESATLRVTALRRPPETAPEVGPEIAKEAAPEIAPETSVESDFATAPATTDDAPRDSEPDP